MRLHGQHTRPLLYALGLTAAAIAAGMPSRCIAGEEEPAVSVKPAKAAPTTNEKTISGREIFVREWLPNDPRSHGGDGLGPVFNDSSCIACHNQGGIGGGGPASKNVDIVSATLSNPLQAVRPRKTVIGSLLGMVFGRNNQPEAKVPTTEQLTRQRENLVKEVTRIHPGFASARSVVIHKSGVEEGYEKWRLKMTGLDQLMGLGLHMQTTVSGPVALVVESGREQSATPADAPTASATHPEQVKRLNRREISAANRAIGAARTASFTVNGPFFSGARMSGNFTMSTSQRNPTALFGVGLIDSIPVEALETAAKKRFEEFPKVSGRLAKLPGDKIGRFGWKAQKATLHDFTMTACAVELGLNVPEHPQSGLPSKPDYKPTGFDLNQQECNALVDYLRNLPAPARQQAAEEDAAKYVLDGAHLFASVGCAACHVEKLGEVNGIYSDLLLHDMGPELGDTGSYGVFIPDSPGGDAESPVPPLAQLKQPQAQPAVADDGKLPVLGAGRLEWRTPPLWGLRDSAPYLHDGRAKTIEQAIAFHGGEGTESAQRYFLLSNEERQKVQAFLKSLIAPTEVAAR